MRVKRILLLLIFLKFILEYAYITFTSKYFEYAGFVTDISIFKYTLGWLIYLIGYKLLFKKRNLFIFEIYYVIFLVYVLPNIIFYSLSNQNTFYFLILTLPYFIIIASSNGSDIFKINSYKWSKPMILLISFLSILLVLMNYLIATEGEMVWSFYDVYDFRTKFAEESSISIFAYLNGWASKIFSVVILAWAVYKKKIFLSLLFIVLILLLFAFSGHKSVLQSLFLIPLFYLMNKSKNSANVITLSFISLIIVSIFLAMVQDINMISSLILRRLLFVPANLNFVYLDFFSNNPNIYWSNSIMKSFIAYPYDGLKTSEVIGEYIGKDMAANTGFIACGFMHAGLIGVSIYTIFAIIIFKFINLFSNKIEKYFLQAIIFIPIFTMFVSADLLTTLLTHGLIIGIFVLWMYDNKNYNLIFNKFKYKI